MDKQPTQMKENGIEINENITVSRYNTPKLSTVEGNGKGKANTLELLDASSDNMVFYTTIPIKYNSESMVSNEDEVKEAMRNEIKSKVK